MFETIGGSLGDWIACAVTLILDMDLCCSIGADLQEAAWAISNATSGGKPEQIKYLVQQGCIPPLCELLEVHDAKIVTVALEGLENILKVTTSA